MFSSSTKGVSITIMAENNFTTELGHLVTCSKERWELGQFPQRYIKTTVHSSVLAVNSHCAA